jgi:tetratricopeptide (TPR) repeat protein
MWENIKDFYERHKVWIAIGTHLITFVGGAIATLGFINTKLNNSIDHIVAKRLAPYERLSGGSALNKAEDWEEAIAVLQTGIELPEFASLPLEVQNLMYDQQLYALANCVETEKHRPKLKRITDRFDQKIVGDGWRYNQAGWFFLKDGDPTQARDYFKKSYAYYSKRQEWKSMNDPCRGLLWVALAEGKVGEATQEAEKTILHNPVEFSWDALHRESKTWDEEGWFLKYRNTYGRARFDETIKEYKKQLDMKVIPKPKG